jgi:MOSC domain-containing protein YiiM
VKHLYLVRKDPEAPNLRQVHLMHRELFDEVGAKGFTVKAGELGENITTEGIDLPNLPVGTKLHLGSDAVVEITGARKPCHQIDKFQQGLLHELLDKSGETLRSKSGIMGIVLAGGDIAPGDAIRVEPPQGPHRPLPLI